MNKTWSLPGIDPLYAACWAIRIFFTPWTLDNCSATCPKTHNQSPEIRLSTCYTEVNGN